ncbi:hypothetical protein LINBF2_12990 [Limnohabitans sp. INBF002]|nr:hypothetical protein LINBF2_12990 [Limnohabitans sp. INBF002]
MSVPELLSEGLLAPKLKLPTVVLPSVTVTWLPLTLAWLGLLASRSFTVYVVTLFAVADDKYPAAVSV